VQLSAIRERVKALQKEIAELSAANEEYLNKHIHSPLVVLEQRSRELRLQQILDELAILTRTKIM
jgi:vacuolar-type H+-ATPase subunit I/STV1